MSKWLGNLGMGEIENAPARGDFRDGDRGPEMRQLGHFRVSACVCVCVCARGGVGRGRASRSSDIAADLAFLPGWQMGPFPIPDMGMGGVIFETRPARRVLGTKTQEPHRRI